MQMNTMTGGLDNLSSVLGKAKIYGVSNTLMLEFSILILVLCRPIDRL